MSEYQTCSQQGVLGTEVVTGSDLQMRYSDKLTSEYEKLDNVPSLAAAG